MVENLGKSYGVARVTLSAPEIFDNWVGYWHFKIRLIIIGAVLSSSSDSSILDCF